MKKIERIIWWIITLILWALAIGGMLWTQDVYGQTNMVPPQPVLDTNAPDVSIYWVKSTNPYVTKYHLYVGHHYPKFDSFTVWTGTNAYITNAPLYQNDLWMSCLNDASNESVYSTPLTITNGFQYVAVTISATGSVFQSDRLGDVWLPMGTNFHGVVTIRTNPPGIRFYKGNGVTISKRYWNL